MPVLTPEAVRINPADSNSEVAIVIDGENPSSSYTLLVALELMINLAYIEILGL